MHKKLVSSLIIIIAIGLLIGFISVRNSAPAKPTGFDAQHAELDVTQLANFSRAKVTEIMSEQDLSSQEFTRIVQLVSVRFLTGNQKNKEARIEFETELSAQKLETGDTVVVTDAPDPSFVNADPYIIVDHYRLPYIGILLATFLLLAVVFGRWRGVTSVIGLAFSIFMLVYFIAPNILSGYNPFIISLIGTFIIAIVSIFLAHGFNQRTNLAVLSTMFVLGLAQVISYIAVRYTRLFGSGSEEAYVLQTGSLGAFDLQGLLFAGIVIGTLGILDDVTTAQTATVDELHTANPDISFIQLYKKGMSVGREHIASLVNSLVLAYAGAFFPLFLLIVLNTSQPLWTVLNSEFISEEIVRTLVGSIVLIFAVPISTVFAAWYFKKNGNDTTPVRDVRDAVRLHIAKWRKSSSVPDRYWDDKV